MHPILAQLGPIPIHTYGFLIAVGFIAAVTTIRKLAIKAQLDSERVLDLVFWCFISGFIGARVVFILTRWDAFMADPISMFKIWEGGLVFYGGPLFATPFGIWYLYRHGLKAKVWRTMDCLLPGLTIAHMFGRFGCLAAGCCYGRPTEGGWGVKLYSDLVERSLQGVPLHPTQLYEAGALFILFLGLLWIFKHKRFDGQVALSYFIAYPVIRSIVETFRGDLIRGFVVGEWLSTSQFISLVVFAVAFVALIIRMKQVHRDQPVGAAR